MNDASSNKDLVVEGDQLHTGYVTHEREDAAASTT